MFSTGQATEGAVNYINANAVCGKDDTSVEMRLVTNGINLTLPKDQACASPIGPKWISSITNWLTFVIDRAGLTFLPGDVCQNPLALHDAILKYINEAIGNQPRYYLVDCEGKLIPSGTQIVTCAEFPKDNTPTVTGVGVGSVLTGSFSVTFQDGAAWIPPGGYASYVGDSGTLEVVIEGGVPIVAVKTGFPMLDGAGIDFSSIDDRFLTPGDIDGVWNVTLMYRTGFNTYTETPGPGPLTYTKTDIAITLTRVS